MIRPLKKKLMEKKKTNLGISQRDLQDREEAHQEEVDRVDRVMLLRQVLLRDTKAVLRCRCRVKLLGITVDSKDKVLPEAVGDALSKPYDPLAAILIERIFPDWATDARMEE